MPELRINTELVEELASRIGGQHVVIEDALNNLRAVNSELAGAWDGPSQDTFEGTYGDWITQLESYSETLTNVQSYLRSVAENFRQLDEAAQQAATGATLAE
jgi:WXG100 family type VII secretion target